MQVDMHRLASGGKLVLSPLAPELVFIVVIPAGALLSDQER